MELSRKQSNGYTTTEWDWSIFFTSNDVDAMSSQNTQTWPELAIDLYDKLTGRDAEITYAFDDFELFIPSSTSPDATHAKWKMNGAIRISTRKREASQDKK